MYLHVVIRIRDPFRINLNMREEIRYISFKCYCASQLKKTNYYGNYNCFECVHVASGRFCEIYLCIVIVRYEIYMRNKYTRNLALLWSRELMKSVVIYMHGGHTRYEAWLFVQERCLCIQLAIEKPLIQTWLNSALAETSYRMPNVRILYQTPYWSSAHLYLFVCLMTNPGDYSCFVLFFLLFSPLFSVLFFLLLFFFLFNSCFPNKMFLFLF